MVYVYVYIIQGVGIYLLYVRTSLQRYEYNYAKFMYFMLSRHML